MLPVAVFYNLQWIKEHPNISSFILVTKETGTIYWLTGAPPSSSLPRNMEASPKFQVSPTARLSSASAGQTTHWPLIYGLWDASSTNWPISESSFQTSPSKIISKRPLIFSGNRTKVTSMGWTKKDLFSFRLVWKGRVLRNRLGIIVRMGLSILWQGCWSGIPKTEFL